MKELLRQGMWSLYTMINPGFTGGLQLWIDLIEGNNGLVRTAHIRKSNYKTTYPIVKLYPLEIVSDVSEGCQAISIKQFSRSIRQ